MSEERIETRGFTLVKPPPEVMEAAERIQAEREAAERAAMERVPGLEGVLAQATLDYAGGQIPALLNVLEYLAHGYPRGDCLVLTGPTGVGKSCAAAAAAKSLHGGARWWWYFPALCNALMHPERRDAEMERACKTHLVVFDDLGVEYLREGSFLDGLVDELFWTRENMRRPTIITTNLSTDQLRARLSPRIVDRLVGWGRIVEIEGESLRRPT